MSLNPYAEALGERDPVEVIAQTPGRLAQKIEGLSAAEIEARPAPGKWSVREIVAHLADCEIAFGFRMHRRQLLIRLRQTTHERHIPSPQRHERS